MGEAELVAGLRARDPEVERSFYDLHVERVYRFALRMAGDPDLARLCTQDAFIRAFDGISGFRGDARLSTWLHSIAVSAVLDRLRRARRLEEREVALDPTLPTPRGAEPAVEPDLRRRCASPGPPRLGAERKPRGVGARATRLGTKAWKVGFTPGLGRSPRTRTLQALDPVGALGALLGQGPDLAVQVTAVLGLRARHVDDLPDLASSAFAQAGKRARRRGITVVARKLLPKNRHLVTFLAPWEVADAAYHPHPRRCREPTIR